MDYFVLATFGLVIGSFLNVCIWRIPREESVVSPPSHCPGCDKVIRAWDNIPVLSYLILGGKCRSCKIKISARYPIIETLNGGLFVLTCHIYGMGWHLPVLLVFVSALVTITFIDLDHQIIPDSITIPGVHAGILAGALILPDPMMRAMPITIEGSALGAAVGFALFLSIVILSRGGMGGGDVKLMAMVGAVVGWKGVLLTTMTGSLLGSVIGLGLVMFKGGGRKTKVPFGPFLSLGALVSLFWGQEILRWYLG